jgi:cyanate permease
VEPLSWIVAALFGLLGGLFFGRQRQDQQAVVGALILSVLIGTVAWIAVPEHLAGPSLVVGCGAGLAGLLVSSRMVRT